MEKDNGFIEGWRDIRRTAPVLVALLALSLGGCTAVTGASEEVVEKKVDQGVDLLVERICKGPVDVAVRTFKRYPALGEAAFETCPDTYGYIEALALRRSSE